MKKEEVGHNFLARLGKTRLRPGGKKATDWLIANGDFSQDKKVLEVACNMGTTAIGLAKQFGCHIEGVDLDEHALEKAQTNIEANGLQEKIHVQRANAMKLPFEDESFDIVMAGGSLRMDGGIIGEATVNFISQFRLDFGILGISAIDADGSLLDYDYHEVQVKRAIIESSRQTLLVTDHSKFTRQAIVRLGELSDVEYLFTDKVPNSVTDYLHDKKTKLVLC